MTATRRSRPRRRRLRLGLGPTDYGDARKLMVVAHDGLRRPGHDELALRRGARDGGGDGNGQRAWLCRAGQDTGDARPAAGSTRRLCPGNGRPPKIADRPIQTPQWTPDSQF